MGKVSAGQLRWSPHQTRSSGKTAYGLPNSVKAIQKEIMKNGPVVAGFTVYEDFAYYYSGIYKHTWGAESGGHAVKVIGWGSEKGTPYWLVANSWHNDWGEKATVRQPIMMLFS
ncbi:papain family cysteine protease [Teladorsagia circumcincta]|uniref:Papain family cysteine protease n=1 Tax=Teladorsagia circumcincta TaxID=45464 RepID=A0A2G9UBS7_TELCI|nr:papain family cysteine protease [Teladorsagia circumcincta]